MASVTMVYDDSSNNDSEVSVGNTTDSYDMYTGEYDLYYSEDHPYLLKVYDFELIVLGVVRPALIILVTLGNIFVAAYFTTRKNRGNSTNILFVSIAFSDTVTGILLLPNSFHVYAGRRDELTREWCNTYMLLRLYASPVFHTVSVWQTLLLSLQRYICVCHPFISARLCTPRKTLIAISIAYGLAFFLHMFHLLDEKASDVFYTCEWKISEASCRGFCIYLWLSLVAQHLMPCLALLWFTANTLRGLKQATRRLSVMSQSSTRSRSFRDRTITITGVLLVVVFLVPELPHGFYKLVITVFAHVNHKQDTFNNHVILSVYEMALLVSFHANFWIYCLTLQNFRKSFIRMASCTSLVTVKKPHKWAHKTVSGRTLSESSGRGSVSMIKRDRVLSLTSSVHSCDAAAAAAKQIHRRHPSSNDGDAGKKRAAEKHDDNDDVFD